MGYKVSIQRVDRGKTKSFYVNLPAAIAEALKIEKRNVMEWLVEDRNTLILKKVKPSKSLIKQTKTS